LQATTKRFYRAVVIKNEKEFRHLIITYKKTRIGKKRSVLLLHTNTKSVKIANGTINTLKAFR
jgi:hypothetical protein